MTYSYVGTSGTTYGPSATGPDGGGQLHGHAATVNERELHGLRRRARW